MSLPDSTNPRIMADNIKRLESEIHNLDSEIPSHDVGDAGKYLGVDNSGDLAFSDVPNELPPTTGATAGQILALDSEKAPAWVDNYNLDYSTNEVNTGVKWIDNKNIYKKVFHFTENINGSHDHNISNFGDLVKCNLVCKRADGYIEQAPIVPRTTGWNMSVEDITTSSFTLFIGSAYTSTYAITDAWVILEYTKTDPEEVTKTTKRKSTK